MGIILSITFLLAHCVEDAQCAPLDPSGRVETEWAVHQVQTAVDFAPGNRVLSWYLGGLNYQIEHHLFPQISHVHYPAIAPLVRGVCEELGVRYRVRPTFWRALNAHFRWLRWMGTSTGQTETSAVREAA
jgi:linoleoyl-CoA desaturase